MATENNFKIKHGLVVSTTASIQSTTQATSTTTGALQVVGGVGIGRNLYVGGTTFLAGDLYVDGTQFTVNSTNISTGDKALYLSTGSNTAITATGSGLAIGPENSTYASFLFDGTASFKSDASIVPTTSTYSLGSQELFWDTLYAKNAVISSVSGYIRADNTGTLTGNATIPGADVLGAVSTATNLAGGTSGSVPYQSASGETSFTNSGTSGWILISNGDYPEWSDPASLLNSRNLENTFVNTITSGTTYYITLNESIGNYSPINSDTALTYNTVDKKLTTTKIAVSSLARATSTATGALTVAGGAGIGGDLYASAIYSNGTRLLPTVVQVFTATVAQSVFTVTNGYLIGNNLQVFANGVLLTPSDYTASNGTSVVLTEPRRVNDQITIISGQVSGYINTNSNVTFQYFGSTLGTGTTINFGTGTTATLIDDVLTIQAPGPGFTGGTSTNAVNILSGDASTSTATGALTVLGGVGISGDLNVGGDIVANKLTIQYTTITTTLVTTGDIINTYNTTESTGTNTGALQIAGGAGIGGNINVGGNVVLNNSALIHNQPAITVNDTIVTLDTFAITDYRSAKYVISVSNSVLGQFQTSEVLLIQDNINSFINQTSVFSADTPLMTFTTLVSGNNVLLKGVGANAGNTVKVQKIYITI